MCNFRNQLKIVGGVDEIAHRMDSIDCLVKISAMTIQVLVVEVNLSWFSISILC